MIGAPGPVLPVIALVVGLRAQREVFGVDAQAVVAAMHAELDMLDYPIQVWSPDLTPSR